MKRFTVAIIVIVTIAIAGGVVWTARSSNHILAAELRSGDIIFQSSMSGQSKAVQLATRSKYSHCGIVYVVKDSTFVIEAVQPVTCTPLAEWIARGDDNHYVVKRLKAADTLLTPDVLARMKEIGEGFMGKHYDLTFE